jgi:glycosyltransferase involved in cell wall biosynthesis
MKILHIITNLRAGGAEKLLLDSIPFYKKEGIDVDLLLLNREDSIFLQNLKTLNICNIYTFNTNYLYNPLLIFKIRPYLKSYKIIHVHLFPALYWVSLASIFSMSSSKLVYTEHSTHNKRRNKLYLRCAEKFIYNQYDKIVSISEHTKINLLKWIGNKYEQKIQVIENGVNLYKYTQASPYNRELLEIPSDTKIILMTARFSIQKDHYTLVKAIGKLLNIPICLILIGDGPLKSNLISLVKVLQIEDRVLFMGIRDDVPQLIKMADICVLSSNWEGFGLVAVEYMAAGKPTIVSDVEGLRDIVTGAGILFKKGDDEDLKNKIEYLLSDKSHYDNMSEKCYKRSLEFSIEKMINSYINVYKEVLNEK